jgi:EAL and modified HD-GYP domain-containing signal transduction protein
MPDEILFARQPIYDRENGIYGFELLYRGDLLLPPSVQATRASIEVLVNFCTGLIEDNATLGCPIFLNVDEEFITSNVFLPLSPENLVIEVLETVRPTPDVIQALTTLKKQGYTITLDDFVFESGKEVFFPLVSIIKIDVLGMDKSTLKHQLQQFDFTGKTLLAEKVEDKAMYEFCKALGFDLFQGYYLERPTIIQGHNVVGNKHTLLNLISQLCKEDVSVQEVSDLISSDPSLVL